MENETIKTNDKPWLFKRGNPGGPGRPKGKSMKEYARDYLASMTDDERQDFMEGIPKVDIWKLAEGNPENKTDITSAGKPIIQIPSEIALKNELNTSPEDNSEGQPQI